MKFRFEVIHMSPFLKQVRDFMKVVDLTMEGIGVRDIMTFTTKEDVAVSKVKETLILAYQSLGHEVLDIQGGQVE